MDTTTDRAHVLNAYAIKNGQWIIDFCEYNDVDETVAIAACVTYKKYINAVIQCDYGDIGLREAYNCAVACLRIAAKLDNQCFDESRSLFNLFTSVEDLNQLEMKILKTLDYNIMVRCPFTILHDQHSLFNLDSADMTAAIKTIRQRIQRLMASTEGELDHDTNDPFHEKFMRELVSSALDEVFKLSGVACESPPLKKRKKHSGVVGKSFCVECEEGCAECQPDTPNSIISI